MFSTMMILVLFQADLGVVPDVAVVAGQDAEEALQILRQVLDHVHLQGRPRILLIGRRRNLPVVHTARKRSTKPKHQSSAARGRSICVNRPLLFRGKRTYCQQGAVEGGFAMGATNPTSYT